ncbi:MAG: hypothetical protein WA766_18540 [Candidatus Acidiferrales bacterium]
MDAHESPTCPFESVEPNLGADDDRDFWRTALAVLADEFTKRHDDKPTRGEWVLLVGACSHWETPHQARWIAGGGFAYPKGYQDGQPKLDWSSILVYRDRRWMAVEKLPKSKVHLCRAAIPARTARHKQAAVHTRWLPGTETLFTDSEI